MGGHTLGEHIDDTILFKVLAELVLFGLDVLQVGVCKAQEKKPRGRRERRGRRRRRRRGAGSDEMVGAGSTTEIVGEQRG